MGLAVVGFPAIHASGWQDFLAEQERHRDVGGLLHGRLGWSAASASAVSAAAEARTLPDPA